MKTSAIAATLFGAATTQTAKTPATGTPADFFQALSTARAAAFSDAHGQTGGSALKDDPSGLVEIRNQRRTDLPVRDDRAVRETRESNRRAERSDDDRGEDAPRTDEVDDSSDTTEAATASTAETVAPDAGTLADALPVSETAETTDKSAVVDTTTTVADEQAAPATVVAPVTTPADSLRVASWKPAVTPVGDVNPATAPQPLGADIAAAARAAAALRAQQANGTAPQANGTEADAASETPAEMMLNSEGEVDAAGETVAETGADPLITATSTTPRGSAQMQAQIAGLNALSNGAQVSVQAQPGAATAPRGDMIGNSVLAAQAVDTEAMVEANMLSDMAGENAANEQQFLNSQASALNAARTTQGRADLAANAGRTFAATMADTARAAMAPSGPTAATTAATSSLGAEAAAGLGTAATSGTTAATAARPAQAAPPSSPAQQVATQMANALSRGQDQISIKLTPHDLGKIEVNLQFKDGHVTASIVADNADTLSMLQKDARALERALTDAGLETDQQSLQFSLRGDGQSQQASRGRQGSQDASRSRAQLLSVDEPSAEPISQSRSRTTVGAIDISV